MRLASQVNQYLSDQAPWALLRSDPPRGATVLYVALRAIDNLKVMLAPFLPFTSQRLHELLGYTGSLAGELAFREVDEQGDAHTVLTGDYAHAEGRWEPSRLPPGQTLLPPEPLFRKLDPEKVVEDELERMRRTAEG